MCTSNGSISSTVLVRTVQTVIAAILLITSLAGFADQKFTNWGWPLPYQKISSKSVQWLKSKGYWPLQVAYQAPWGGANAQFVVMVKKGFLKDRGIDAQLKAFNAGYEINEVATTGKVQVAMAGNFPFTSLMDHGIPVKSIGVITPNILHAVIVPNNSPVKTLKDFKGSNPPAVVGIVTGSSAEFYFTEAAKVNDLIIGKDVVLKNMSIPDQILMPKGLAAVVPWDFAATLITKFKKKGRIVDTIYPYNFYEGNLWIRQDIIEHAPDVAQAVSDAYIETVLWIRLHTKEAVDILVAQPRMRHYDKQLMLQQTDLYNNYYKPTALYPFAEFWGKENARIAKWLYDGHRTKHLLTAKDYVAAFDKSFMTKTFEKLGWKIPSRPPFLPKDWNGEIGKVPYPPYYNAATLKAPRPWPEPGDLVKPWKFNGKTFQP